MIIGIEGQRLFRKKKHGMDMVALELINSLQKIDKKNQYYIFVKPDVDKCISDTENFKIVELGGGPYPSWEQIALPRAAKRLGCEILHCTSNTAPLKTRIPLVITLHDIIYLESISIFKKAGTWYQKFGNMYRRMVVPRVVKNSDIIITVSEFEKDRINTFFGFTDNRLRAVYNGVSEHFRKIENKKELERVQEEYDLPDEFIFLLGNTDPKKNMIGALKAFSEFIKRTDDKIPLVILDYDREDLRKMLIEINDIKLDEHIHLLGYVVNTDLPVMYNMARFFLYPSLRESFGIPQLEAMKCGTAVITSNTSSMPEVSGGAAMITDPFDPESITVAMLELNKNPKLRNELIIKGYDNASKYSWEAMAEHVLELYVEVFDSKKKYGTK